MSQTEAHTELTWHSSQGRFAHNHPRCPIARYVAPRQRIAGSGGRPLCRECERLTREEAVSTAAGEG